MEASAILIEGSERSSSTLKHKIVHVNAQVREIARAGRPASERVDDPSIRSQDGAAQGTQEDARQVAQDGPLQVSMAVIELARVDGSMSTFLMVL